MVVWLSVPTRLSGIGHIDPPFVASCCWTTFARYSRLTWCTMPVAGGTTRKLSNGLLAPLQELVALAVALELALGVVEEREALSRTDPPAPSGR